jgi:hypothetical protein
MKRILCISVLIIVFWGCQKQPQIEENKMVTLNELKEICSKNPLELASEHGNECLPINPYYVIGEKIGESFMEFEKHLQSGKVKVEHLDSIFVKTIKTKLPPDLTELPTVGYSEYEDEVYSLIIKAVANDDFDTFYLRVSCIEKVISQTKCLNLYAQKRILVYCTVIKSIAGCLREMSTQHKIESWDDCFRRKQLEKLQSGWIEKLRCVAMWPECLGVMAADCLIEQIF